MDIQTKPTYLPRVAHHIHLTFQKIRENGYKFVLIQDSFSQTTVIHMKLQVAICLYHYLLYHYILSNTIQTCQILIRLNFVKRPFLYFLHHRSTSPLKQKYERQFPEWFCDFKLLNPM